jgi:hypothetical protein
MKIATRQACYLTLLLVAGVGCAVSGKISEGTSGGTGAATSTAGRSSGSTGATTGSRLPTSSSTGSNTGSSNSGVAGSSSGGGGTSSGISGGANGGTSGGPGGSGTSGGWPPLPATPATPQLWYWHQSYLSTTNPAEPMHSEALIDQAVDAGYTGLALWDAACNHLNKPGFDPSMLQTVMQYAVAQGLQVLPDTAPFGYSNDGMLYEDGNLAEGMAVVGTQFTVAAGGAAADGGNVLAPINSLPPVVNGDFEGGETGWFSLGDPRVSLDTTASDCYSGNACAEISGSATATDNARLEQGLTLTPWRLYHIQFWMSTNSLAGNNLEVEVLDFSNPSNTVTLMDSVVDAASATTGWTEYDLAFNSRDSTAVGLYLGMWGGNQGTVWIDDILAEETSLVNVLRRDGTPVSVYSGSTTYTEGTDYSTIIDPALPQTTGDYENWHTPPTVTVPVGSQLQLGQTVSANYYTVIPLAGGQVGSCLSEPAVQTWLATNSTLITQSFPAGTGVFLGYDEMRQVNSCALCRSKNMTAGQLLAWNVQQTWATVGSTIAGPAYVWSDMFDPYHNAIPAYQYVYPVEGDLTGSWLGLQPGFIIMNWNLGNLTESLGWFAGTQAGEPQSFQEIIAGYYDSGDGAGSATSELQSATGIPGVIGMMYTTWEGDYSQMGAFATAARQGWPAYVASTTP